MIKNFGANHLHNRAIMKKFSALLVLLFIVKLVTAQSYYNEWIDFNKTYYKFKIGSAGLYRINVADLAQLGLANEPAQNFQVWRNGKQVVLYTSAQSGPLGANGYIEFWGEKNDGLTDLDLYRLPEYQLSNQESLITDTAAFFLTAGAGNNARYIPESNVVAGNTLPAEPYFIYSARKNFKERIHRGRAQVVGEYVYSSSYDMGEMWTSLDISPGAPASVNFNNLFVAPTGPSASFSIGMAGSSPSGFAGGSPPRDRRYMVTLNNTTIIDTILNQFESRINYNSSINLAVIAGNSAAISIINSSIPGSVNPTDRVVCAFVDLKYPRLFNFDNQLNFQFNLSASATSRYLEITNLNTGGVAPILYDINNRKRYVADVSGTGVIRFVIQPSATETKFVLVSQAIINLNPITVFQTRNFTNYTNSANQGNYLMITHPTIQANYAGANQVELYRQYRSSITGGSYNAKIYDINELVDQFGYGIKKTPQSIKNFLRFARNTFPFTTQYAFLVGRGLTYADYRENESNPMADRLNLIPTFGYPASDVLLASNNLDPVMNTFISRISVLTPKELSEYLDKIKQYEQAQQSTSQTITDKAWMKNVVHVVGANDAGLESLLKGYMDVYKATIKDTMFGGNVYTFSKSTTGPATPIVNSLLGNLFETGIGLISYFGHSSATSLDYNLDDPNTYNSTGKYPLFLVSGCLAGDLYYFDPPRFTTLNTISEKFVLAPQKGGIGFIASTSFGIDTYLHFYNKTFYKSISTTGYGKPITYNMSEAITAMNTTFGTGSYFGRLHSEQTTLNGDPVFKVNYFPKPDYVVEEAQIQVVPNILSVADVKFTVKARFYNIGKATNDSVSVQIKRRFSNGVETILYTAKLKPINYADSVTIDVPIAGVQEKGTNQIIVSVDTDNQFDELSETNNIAIKTFNIFEDQLTPVYPANFAIIKKSTTKLYASTANPLVASREYLMEMDTTELFNSPFKISKNLISAGGLLEFDPGISFTDSTVYYWRVAPAVASGTILWNTVSFVYLNGTSTGNNQSHFYQHTKSVGTDIYLDSATRQWKFSGKSSVLTIINSIYPSSGTEDNHFSLSVNGSVIAASACLGSSVIFNVFEPVGLLPLYNQAAPSTFQSGPLGGFMGSAANCVTKREFNFEFSYLDTTGRRKMRDFLDWVPTGYYVTARLILDQPYSSVPFAANWKNDSLVYGSGNTAYSRFKSAGFADFDDYSFPRTWAFIYRKGNTSFQPKSIFSAGLGDRITMNSYINLPGTKGYISSPKFGPAKNWKDVKWRGYSLENNPKDIYSVNIIGVKSNGDTATLYTLQPNQQDFNISSINASVYPYIQLGMNNQDLDSSALTPYQLRYWRLLYDPLPEGAIAPNVGAPLKDTLQKGEPLTLSIPFKNVSDAPFADSMKINLGLEINGTSVQVPVPKHKVIQPGDTALLNIVYDTKNLSGVNTLSVDFNPNNDQPEQYHFNNFLVKNFYVKGDITNPIMDVTFDGIHILNNDIVSAKPKIVIKLKDEAKFLQLDDTALATVYIRYPNSPALVRFPYSSDTLRFIPADASSGKNEATIEFTPTLMQDSENGENYELVVKAKDKSGNPAGNKEYRVQFQVINKPMISNMFNYPNPFTTSTAFVFTITGSQVPQNIRIQILTITGKIVREVTMQELGPLHIGRNITEYKWDGTDQYGSKLANGVYLYRVLTNLNGVSLEKYNTVDASGDKVNTDKYFNKGYGKMYLMR